MWMKRPILGYGLGTIECISGIFNFLVGAGIIIVLMYFNILVRFSLVNNKDKLRNCIFFILIFVLPNLVLNDYLILMSLSIPIAGYAFSLKLNENEDKIY